MGQGWSDSGCPGVAVQGRAGKAPKTPLMRLYGPINDKPPSGGRRGLDVAIGLPYAEFAHRRRVSLARLNDLSTYLYASAILDGETTRRSGLNSDRGGGPLNAQRVVGKREPHTENREKLPTADGSVSHITARFWLGVIPFRNRADSPSVIGGKR